jgi:hypothetical protein
MTATMRAARFDGTGLSVQGDPVRLVVQPWA